MAYLWTSNRLFTMPERPLLNNTLLLVLFLAVALWTIFVPCARFLRRSISVPNVPLLSLPHICRRLSHSRSRPRYKRNVLLLVLIPHLRWVPDRNDRVFKLQGTPSALTAPHRLHPTLTWFVLALRQLGPRRTTQSIRVLGNRSMLHRRSAVGRYFLFS